MKATITLAEQENGAVKATLEFQPPCTESASNPVVRAAMFAMEALSDAGGKRTTQSCRFGKKEEHVCACSRC